MATKKKYTKPFRESDRNYLLEDILLVVLVATFVFVLLMLAGCERRELYVYGDEFHSVELEVDWRKYADRDPDGMTVWFYPLDNLTTGTVPVVRKPYRTTTANVRHHDLYLPGGRYQGVVIDYSPEEYGRQQFLDLDSLPAARIESTLSSYQPDSLTVSGEGVPAGLSDEVNWELYGEPAWTDIQENRPPIRESTGLYTVANQPEDMALDTLDNQYIAPSEYGDYIPWQERDTYQSRIVIKHLLSEPESIVWKLRIRVYISEGFNYLWQIPASITGLSDGHYLPRDENTDSPCILSTDGWELERTGENSGYISTTVQTFGLRPETLRPDRQLHHGTRSSGTVSSRNSDPDLYDYYSNLCVPGDLRLNLAFTLRDHATTLYYHFNVGHMVVSYDEQLVLRIDLGPDFFGSDDPPIVLPYVDAYNGTGFGADVTPWEEMPPVDVTF